MLWKAQVSISDTAKPLNTEAIQIYLELNKKIKNFDPVVQGLNILHYCWAFFDSCVSFHIGENKQVLKIKLWDQRDCRSEALTLQTADPDSVLPSVVPEYRVRNKPWV